jgi:hypothetical protein
MASRPVKVENFKDDDVDDKTQRISFLSFYGPLGHNHDPGKISKFQNFNVGYDIGTDEYDEKNILKHL